MWGSLGVYIYIYIIRTVVCQSRTISAQVLMSSVGNCTHNYFARIRRCGRFARSFVPRVLREYKKERRCHDSREMVELINSDPAVSWCSGDMRWKLDLLLWARDQETEFPVEACWLSRTQEGQDRASPPTNIRWFPFFLTALVWSTGIGFPMERTVKQGILYWGF